MINLITCRFNSENYYFNSESIGSYINRYACEFGNTFRGERTLNVLQFADRTIKTCFRS